MTDLLSVIIPSKNEPLLQELVNDVNQALGRVKHEIIVIDKSETKPTLRDAKLISQQSEGLGKAVLEAIPHASGNIILIMDGDYSHDPFQLKKLIETSQNSDIVLGSRYVAGGRNLDTLLRKHVSKAYNRMARLILRVPLTDPMSGLCAIRRAAFEAVSLNPIGYKVNLEIIYKAQKQGFTVTEVPITFHARRAGRSKAGIVEGLRTLLFILALRLGLR